MLFSESGLSVLSVKQLNFYVKSLLESDVRLVSCAVSGEISNFKRHFASGHCYFTLKDEAASVKCVMFKAAAMRCPFEVKDGLKVICKGRVSLYEKDGTYQFYVEGIEPDGIGSKALALKQLKEKLANEGLFDIENKRKLPKFPKKIAVLTSGSGAALHDIINVISRRCSICEILVASVSVQGVNAVREMINMLSKVYLLDDIDLIIIGRGGGSGEDLDAFNDEQLARKVFESPFPIISAVGHETDTTVCDLVADMRAPTPSAAAELAVPDMSALKNEYFDLFRRINVSLKNKIELYESKVKAIKNLSCFLRHAQTVETRALLLDKYCERVYLAFTELFKQNETKLSKLCLQIEALSPLKILARGYGVVSYNQKTLTSVKETKDGDELNIKLADGSLSCRVTGVFYEE